MLIVFSIAIISSNNLYTTNEISPINETNLTATQTFNETTNSTQDNQNTSNNSNATNSTETSVIAADNASGSDIHGVWLLANDTLKLNSTDIDNLLKMGITDIFVKTNRIADPTFEGVLAKILSLVNGKGLMFTHG